jgi:hypothetical protein
MRCTTFQDGSNWSILEGASEPRSTPSSVKIDSEFAKSEQKYTVKITLAYAH